MAAMSGVVAYESHLSGLAVGDGDAPSLDASAGAFFLERDGTGGEDDGESSPRARNASVDESVTESQGVFEGPEKTLEVCFSPGVGAPDGCRGLTRAQLDDILREARCEILSATSNAHLDAYVLSESSLFVYPCKVVIKTCGRTTLLRCLRALLGHATAPLAEGGRGLVLEWVGYSRKNYAFPDEQPSPHTSFGEELAYLRNHRDDPQLSEAASAAFDGQGYVLGPITGDHWFVYVADQCERPAASSTERTLNVMMFDLPEDVRSAFYLPPPDAPGRDPAKTVAREMTERSGLIGVLPSTSHLDDHAFAPCGYSMNALCFESYTTVHVTPERDCSYASFETNTALRSYASLVKNVLAVFKPARVVLTLFADEAGLRELPRAATFDGLPELDVGGVGVYRRADLSSLHVEHDCCCMMANYHLVAKDTAGGRRASPFRDRTKAPSPHVGSLQ